MSKLLEKAVKAVEQLPEARRDEIARYLLDSAKGEAMVLSENEKAAVQAGLADARKGRFVSTSTVERLFEKHRAG